MFPIPATRTTPLRLRLEVRAMFAVLALLAATIGAILALQAVSGRWWVARELERESRDVARHFAMRFAELRVADGGAPLPAMADMAFHDPHVAFLIVRDPDGAILEERVRDPRAFADYAQARAGCDGPTLCPHCESVPVRARSGMRGHAASEPLWTRSRDLRGVVVIGVVDPAYNAIGAQRTRASVAAALVVGAVAIPLVAMGARRLAAPLRRVAEAAESLAAGKRPEPLPPGGARELDSLAASFNRMASSLDRASRDLQAANARLESTVQRRTAELREVNARLELELTERARFFRAISHDLGAPLRNMAGALMLLRRRHARILPADALDGLDRVERGIELELGMLHELLEISRLGASEERPEPVETLAVVHDVAHTFNHDLRSRSIEFVARGPMPVVRVERARFRQAVQNLVDNAIKYMGDARAERRIEVAAVVRGSHAEFTVTDTGSGIPEREQDGIFEVFRRASNAPSGVRGSGVGLAAVKAIVERWGGSIRVESVEGAGSRFIFTVPGERVLSRSDNPARSENRVQRPAG